MKPSQNCGAAASPPPTPSTLLTSTINSIFQKLRQIRKMHRLHPIRKPHVKPAHLTPHTPRILFQRIHLSRQPAQTLPRSRRDRLNRTQNSGQRGTNRGHQCRSKPRHHSPPTLQHPPQHLYSHTPTAIQLAIAGTPLGFEPSFVINAKLKSLAVIL